MKKIKAFFSKTLYLELSFSIILGLVCGVVFYSVLMDINYKIIDSKWVSETYVPQKVEKTVQELQKFINENNISSNQPYEIYKWSKSHPLIYFYMERDGQILYNFYVDYSKDDAKTISEYNKELSSESDYYTSYTYNYTITETAGDAEGYIYDTKAYPVVVTVEDENGKLVATAAYGEANETSLTVTNIYDPKDAVAAPQARKVVDDTSGSAPDEEFEFQLLDAEGNVVETVKAPAGYVNFSELTFDKVGTYSYTIKEVSGSTAGFTYDTEGRNLQIVVEDAGKGELKATIDYLNDEGEIVITNPYEPDPASITFTVEKIVEGVSANAKAQDFSFVLSDEYSDI